MPKIEARAGQSNQSQRVQEVQRVHSVHSVRAAMTIALLPLVFFRAPGALAQGSLPLAVGNTPTTYAVNQSHPQASDDNPGTEAQPFKTIGKAALLVKPGDTVIIRGGVYREAVTITTSGTAQKPITFMAAPAEHVVVTGADEITDWRREEGGGPVFSAPWPHRFITHNKTMTHPSDDYHLMIGRAEQVHVNGYPLLQVPSRSQMSRGTFFADLDNKRLFICDRAGRDMIEKGKGGKPLVEASTRETVWTCYGACVTVRGLRFRYAANRAQQGAAEFSGAHDVIEDCVFERMNAGGASFRAPDITVRRCLFQQNGQLGFGANRAHNLLFTECAVRENNVKGFNRGWEAGADKLVLCRGAVLEKSVFAENRGNGVWFDIGNENCVVRNCLIADNEGGGVFYEISYGLHVQDNVIIGNGFDAGAGAWGANGGVSLSSSPNCVVERNLIAGNREGFQFREQTRATKRIDDPKQRAIWNHDSVIRNNLIAYNQDAQVGGWFDGKDQRLWPASMRTAMAEKASGKGGDPVEDIAAPYKAKGIEGAPPAGLSLEKLNLVFENNIYAVNEGQGFYQWGCTWRPHKLYASLGAVQKELSLEKGSRLAPIAFNDLAARDFRLPSASLAHTMGCYPKGSIPTAILGVLGIPAASHGD